MIDNNMDYFNELLEELDDNMILITGATGGLGRNLVKTLVADGTKIRVYVRDAQKAQQMLRGNIEIVQGDLSDQKALKKAMTGINLIYHCAANTSLTAPYQVMHRDNVIGTKNVIEAAAGRKVICVSSTAVYSRSLENPITEDSPCSPPESYVYGRTKAEADKLALKMGAIVIRSTYIYGANMQGLGIFQLLKMVEKGIMPIVGKGWNRLHYTHVSDVVQGLIRTGEKGKAGEAYNIAGPEYVSQKEFLTLLAKYLKVSPPKLHVPIFAAKAIASIVVPGYLESANTVYADRIYDITKAKKELGYKPKIKYEVGLKEVVAAYKASISQ